MDDERSGNELTDAALNRDIEAALAVDPSPEFVARVRMSVQRERDAAASPWRWRIAGAVAFVAIIAFVVAMSRPDRARVARDESPAGRQPTVASGAPDSDHAAVAQDSTAGQAFRPAPSNALRRSAGRRSRPSVAVSQPQLLIAPDETMALRQLFSHARKELADPSALQEVALVTAALQPPSDISFPPITFEPIAPEILEEGERQ